MFEGENLNLMKRPGPERTRLDIAFTWDQRDRTTREGLQTAEHNNSAVRRVLIHYLCLKLQPLEARRFADG